LIEGKRAGTLRDFCSNDFDGDEKGSNKPMQEISEDARTRLLERQRRIVMLGFDYCYTSGQIAVKKFKYCVCSLYFFRLRNIIEPR
jgi:hypothetical protein